MPSIMHNYTIMHKVRLASVGGIDGPIIGAKKHFINSILYFHEL